MLVLGIESSCDETGLALYAQGQGLLGQVLHSQAALHAQYGGVVPELASRDHVRRLPLLLEELLGQCELGNESIEAVAYTRGPGLAGALLGGAMFARGLALGLSRPVLGVHHMEGHLLSPLLEANPPDWPFTSLLVSGGHSMLVDVAGLGRYRLLGQTLDDAAGEAFDKCAALMGLPYPGGAALSALAQQGDAAAFVLPRPMLDRAGLDFSFSGLKTAVLTSWRKLGDAPTQAQRADLAASFEAAIIETLVEKCRRALRDTGHHRLVVAGGVSANARLRVALELMAEQAGAQVWYPSLPFCTDNGAMIALVGAMRLAQGERERGDESVRPRWPMTELRPPTRPRR